MKRKSRWTIGKRVGVGFGLVVVVLGVVAGWSILGFNGIVDSLSEAVACNVVQNQIIKGEVEHLNWANTVNALLTDETVTELTVQTDPTKCAFGEWYYGEGRRTAEELVPETRGPLAAIEDAHRRLHESAIKIGQVFVQADAQLPAFLAAEESDHLKWGAAVRDTFIEERDSLNVQTDPTKCTLGKWLTSDQATQAYQRGDHDFKKAWDQMADAHKRLHESAYKIEQNLAFNRVAAAHKVKEEVSAEWEKVAQDLFQALETGMEQVIDPAKEKAEVAKDVDAMAKWGQIDMEINEGIIQPFMSARIAIGKIAADGYTEERWATYEGYVNEFNDGIENWFTLVEGSAELEETVNTLKGLSTAWANGAHRYHQATQDELEATASLDTAKKIFQEETLAAVHETLTHLEELRTEAEHELAGMNKANAVFASKTKLVLEEVQHLLGVIEEHTHHAAQAENEAIETRAEDTRLAVGIVGAIAVVVGILLAFFIARSIIKVLTHLVAGLNEGADQVNDAAAQVSSASQQLAEGASEQASSLEETSSALEQMAAMTRTNAGNAKEANELAGQARRAADEGDKTMAKLNGAMTGINEASDKISKIIKVIEEIAFQTNLLALNAAVEAARAGEHGKGFAVVADEVRNLAQRAAQAARETTGLIDDSVSRSREGTEVAGEVAKALSAIVGDVAEVTELVNGISQASEEQAQGVDQVNTAVGQMDKVTQQNASGAEESASAAEELAAQAAAVRGMMDELSGLVGGKAAEAGRSTSSATATATKKKHLDVRLAHLTKQDQKRPELATAATPAGGPPEDFMSLDDKADNLKEF